ncbi:DUF2256 domain-containing protein [Pseudoalteromonas pernae]|uniref:DUF2256 domain-containing protein n=1 Tax=Pseudoalteromonas pernae TaxID=3118054 RepID=UPI0032428098
MAHKKAHLPSKTCPICGLVFSWRKKWQLNWEEVKYCSKRCAKARKAQRNGPV